MKYWTPLWLILVVWVYCWKEGMGSIYSNKNRVFGSSSTTNHSNPVCTRTHQIGALALIFTTFFITRVLDQCFNSFEYYKSQNDDVVSMRWPERGYGTHLSLKIYVYEENEIEGLKELMYGRDGKISPDMCVKGQWATQVSSLLFIYLFIIFWFL